MNAREYYTVWLSKRELKRLAKTIADLYEVEIDPAELADNRNLDYGAYGANLLQKLARYGLSTREALMALEYTLTGF